MGLHGYLGNIYGFKIMEAVGRILLIWALTASEQDAINFSKLRVQSDKKTAGEFRTWESAIKTTNFVVADERGGCLSTTYLRNICISLVTELTQ